MKKKELTTSPFVFVDPEDGTVRFVASSYDLDGEFGALAIEGAGEIEYITTVEN